MHLIGILSDSHDWHSEEIDFFLKKNNCDVIKLNFDDFLLKLKNNKITFLNNKRIAKLDGIWVRYINTGSIEEITTKFNQIKLRGSRIRQNEQRSHLSGQEYVHGLNGGTGAPGDP